MIFAFHITLRQVGGFLRFPPPIQKTDRYDITERLLNVALNTMHHPSLIVCNVGGFSI